MKSGTLFALTASSFIISYFLTVFLERRVGRTKYKLMDLHKKNNPFIPTFGGLAPLIATYIASQPILTSLKNPSLYLTVLLTAALSALIGLIDDLFSLNKYVKVAFTVILLTPLSLASSTRHHLTVQGNIIRVLIYVVTGTFIINATNTLAGFNGLEAGLSIIISIYIASISNVKAEAAAAAIYTAANTAFLIRNFYPAKIFPGNVGTFFFGGFLASYSIATNQVLSVLPLYLPHFIDFILKFKSKLETRKLKPAEIDEKGKLKPPGYLSLMGYIIKGLHPSEKSLVITMYTLEIAIAVITYMFNPQINQLQSLVLTSPNTT